ncbi:MAG: hypothetical protein KGY75_10340 [Candidatus Cloacimonetes bacterium]|nr:hypothetical protein [Candidatus Cloacimonadota bacterium]
MRKFKIASGFILAIILIFAISLSLSAVNNSKSEQKNNSHKTKIKTKNIPHSFSTKQKRSITKTQRQKIKYSQSVTKHQKSRAQDPASSALHQEPNTQNPTPGTHISSQRIEKKYKTYHHKPYNKTRIHKVHYPAPIKYHYTVSPHFIYRGLWIRISVNHYNGFCFYNGYPYFVYNGYLHRYSSYDPGSYDLVDSYTNNVYATFYGSSIKQSYDRCAELRDLLNNKLGEYRYFCAEKYKGDSKYSYDW